MEFRATILLRWKTCKTFFLRRWYRLKCWWIQPRLRTVEAVWTVKQSKTVREYRDLKRPSRGVTLLSHKCSLVPLALFFFLLSHLSVHLPSDFTRTVLQPGHTLISFISVPTTGAAGHMGWLLQEEKHESTTVGVVALFFLSFLIFPYWFPLFSAGRP